MKNKIHILNRLICFPLLVVLGLYFVSPSATFKKLGNQSSLVKKNKDSAKSSKAELRVAIVAIVQVFHSVFQPVIFTELFTVFFSVIVIVLFIQEFKTSIGYFRHLFTHVIATNAP